MTTTLRPADADPRWTAVLRRDASADGRFVYAVRTTRIFCRPVCPSRRPSSERVEFFSSAADARGAGYRPCRRCRPESESVLPADVALAHKLCARLDAEPAGRISLGRAASELGVSARHLQRIFVRVTGITPRQYAEARRNSHLRTHLRKGKGIVTAMYDAGINSTGRLYERAHSELGMTPGDYRREGEGVVIRWTTAQSPLGRLMVATTDRGVCAVHLADDDDALGERLLREFPRAELRRDEGGELAAYVAEILRHLAGEQPHLRLPLDIRATAFQRRVWQALCEIPYGETRSYADVAREIGSPGAVRAVGTACGANPVPLVIPCHRVVRSDGSLGGFGLGLPRKRALLAAECAPRTDPLTSGDS